MAEKITLQTIESLPFVEEVSENTTLVGWDGEKTVRVAKDKVGGTSLPEAVAHQYLVTNKEGNWETVNFDTELKTPNRAADAAAVGEAIAEVEDTITEIEETIAEMGEAVVEVDTAISAVDASVVKIIEDMEKLPHEDAEGNIHMLDTKFIPEEIARVDQIPDTSALVSTDEQDLSNDQQMQARKNLGLAYVGTNKVTVLPLSSYENGAYAELDMSWRDLRGKTIIAVYDGVRYETKSDEAYTGGQDAGVIGNGALYESYYFSDTGEPFVVCTDSITVSSGNIRFSDDGVHTLEVYIEESVTHPLDPEFLPTTVPVIQTAQVGQTVVVKAVDENGKPTEWEAKDMGGGAPISAIHYWSGLSEYKVYGATYNEVLSAFQSKGETGACVFYSEGSGNMKQLFPDRYSASEMSLMDENSNVSIIWNSDGTIGGGE